MSKPKLWDEYTVIVHNDEIGFDIPICGLCGNSGVLDTRTTVKWHGKPAGIIHYCICPNGRSRKRRRR